MKKIVLYGKLAKDFGREIMLNVNSVGEAVRALEANFPGRFHNAIRDGEYRVAHTATGVCMDETILKMQISSKEIHIEPVLRGAGGDSKTRGGQSKGKAIGKVVVGVVLIALSIIFPPLAPFILGPGVGLVLSGTSDLLARTPRLSSKIIANREKPEERTSFLFQGAVNTVEQGGPVPLIYGTIRTGSVVVSTSLSVEDVPV